ncbi:velvet factor-domain-containing protein [Flagelloscypha sp. PMI_526]|nr:velvet factor-domain-containing protein [Flagelloscypha sp. PMI_526]
MLSNHLCYKASHVAKHLSGSTFVQPILTDHPETGARCLVFLFSNLSVAIEGDFYLRYRIFDILAGTTPQGHYPVLAACFGGAFRVYTANLFPGLVPSTPLTLQLSQAGERVNVRRALRKPQGGGEAARTPEDEIDDEEYA